MKEKFDGDVCHQQGAADGQRDVNEEVWKARGKVRL
jgi:hypothetical protein